MPLKKYETEYVLIVAWKVRGKKITAKALLCNRFVINVLFILTPECNMGNITLEQQVLLSLSSNKYVHVFARHKQNCCCLNDIQ